MYSFLPFPSMAAFLLFLTITYSIPSSQSLDDGNFRACKTPVLCGMQNLSYPFWGVDRPKHCGRDALHLYCEQDEYLALNISNTRFRVGRVNESYYSMTLSRTDFNQGCPVSFINSTFNLTLFRIPPDTSKFTSIFYGCPVHISSQYLGNRKCFVEEGNKKNSGLFYLGSLEFSGLPLPKQQSIMSSCTGRIEVPVSNEIYDELFKGSLVLQEAIDSGFLVEYITEDVSSCSVCSKSEGSCGTNSTSDNQFVCFCPDEPHSLYCSVHGKFSALRGILCSILDSLSASQPC